MKRIMKLFGVYEIYKRRYIHVGDNVMLYTDTYLLAKTHNDILMDNETIITEIFVDET